jgi:hypothetical protein
VRWSPLGSGAEIGGVLIIVGVILLAVAHLIVEG